MLDQAEQLRKLMRTIPADKPSSSVIKASHSRSRVITVTSGKGGVGKTNFTVNLALGLANLGQKVLIVDADLGMGNVDIVLGCSAPYHILHLLEGGFSLADIISEGPCGVKFMSGGSGIYGLANLNDVQLAKIINQLSLLDDLVDIILIDTGAGIHKSVMNFVAAADEVVIVTTPEPTSITDAYAMVKTYTSYSQNAVVHLVVNRISEIDEGNLTAEKLIKASQKFLSVSINNLGFIYEDHNLVKAVKKQMPLLLAFPDTASARCINQIAACLLYGSKIEHKKGIRGVFNRFLELIR